MPCNQHKTVTVNSVDEGIHQVWQLAFTLRDLHCKRVLDSDLYEKMKIQKPEKKDLRLPLPMSLVFLRISLPMNRLKLKKTNFVIKIY